MTDTPTCPEHVHPGVWDRLHAVRKPIEEQTGRSWLSLAETANLAWFKAREYIARGSAFADYQPRNGTAYHVVLLDMVDCQAKALLEKKIVAAGAYDDPPKPILEDDRLRWLADARTKAQADYMGPAYSWGGELLVALPELAGGRSRAFGMTDYFEAGYVAEAFGLRTQPDAVAVGEFLTLFGTYVLALRDQPTTRPGSPLEAPRGSWVL